MDTTLPSFLTPSDVGLWLHLPTRRVCDMARKGLIPCTLLPNGDLLFSRAELRQWVSTLPRKPREVSHAD